MILSRIGSFDNHAFPWKKYSICKVIKMYSANVKEDNNFLQTTILCIAEIPETQKTLYEHSLWGEINQSTYWFITDTPRLNFNNTYHQVLSDFNIRLPKHAFTWIQMFLKTRLPIQTSAPLMDCCNDGDKTSLIAAMLWLEPVLCLATSKSFMPAFTRTRRWFTEVWMLYMYVLKHYIS